MAGGRRGGCAEFNAGPREENGHNVEDYDSGACEGARGVRLGNYGGIICEKLYRERLWQRRNEFLLRAANRRAPKTWVGIAWRQRSLQMKVQGGGD